MTSNVKLVTAKTTQIFPYMRVAQSTWKRTYQGILLISDAIMLLLAFSLAYWVRFYSDAPIFREGALATERYTRLVLTLLPVLLLLFILLQLYDFRYLLNGTSEYARAVLGCTSGMMLVVLVSFAIPEFVIARGWLTISWLFSIFLVSIMRWFLRRVAHALRYKGWFVKPAVIVGTNAEAISLATQLCESVYSGLYILGFVAESASNSDRNSLQPIAKLPVLGTLDRLPEIVKRQGAEEVIVATTALTRTQLLDAALQLSDMPQVNISLSSGLYEIFTTGLWVSTHNSVPLLNLNRLRLEPTEIILKMLLDFLVILVASPFLLLLSGMIALLIKLDSPGPILYRRRVLGIGGKEFDAFKFRTMVMNGDEVLAKHPELVAELQANYKLKDDPRITRVGSWLRQRSLDELPQLINVLQGQMSLVGPRMITLAEACQYGNLKQNLLTVKPGLTGLWQVSGRSDLTYGERVQLDMHYIRNYSIWLDLQILLFQTPRAVFRRHGAY